MRKILVVAVLLAVVTSAWSQDFRVGVKAGGNLSSLNISSGGYDLSPASKIGFQAGVTLDYGFTESVYLLTGLEVTQKGFKFDVGDLGDIVEDVDFTYNAVYVQLPVNIGYKFDLGFASFIPQLGPYVAYGIAGKSLGENTFGEGGFKRLDYGLGIGVGLDFNHLGFKVGYEYGLANIDDSNDDDDAKYQNRNLFLSVGFKF
jgi:hypothetical protein